MKRLLLLLAILAGVTILGRRLSGRFRERIQALPERMMSGMQQMMEKMPEDFP
jgi:hypothetical protein